jgi:hypothetical protein
MEGKMDCYALKPVISAKYNLWGGFETCESLAEKLNTEIRDPYSEDGYSLVAVHSWSNSVDSLLYVRSLLEQGVRVVAPDEFVSLISKAICSPIIPDSPEIEVVPNPVLDDVRFRLRGICCEDYQIKISDMTGKEFDFDFAATQTIDGWIFEGSIEPLKVGYYNFSFECEQGAASTKIFKFN